MTGEPTNQPPFDPPQNFKKARLWVERKIPSGYSDGDKRHWPGTPDYRPATDVYYLCYLGQGWAKEDGIAQPGVQYYLDKLPDGYATFETDQKGGGQYYRRLFGHPKGRFYDSAIRFMTHFLWLVNGMEGECECVLCGNKTTAPPASQKPRAPREVIDYSLAFTKPQKPRGSGDDNATHDSSRASSTGEDIAPRRAQRQLRQPGAPLAVDEEGTEDVYKDCVKKLENAKDGKVGLEMDLTEETSIDWKADRKSLPKYLTQIEQQHSFIPRIGELVLWSPTFLDDHYLMLDAQTSEFKFYSFEQKCFHGFPPWRGGIVTTVPSARIKNGSIDFTDILDVPHKKTAFNTAGFRIETMPDPNDDIDKGLSKQYRYVPLRNIRPLAHWQILLKGIPQNKLHPSIEYALTCMTSISLIEKWRLKGDWPNGSVLCKGIYMGSELITVGDAVRLASPGPGNVPQPDVLIVDSIRYNLLSMQTQHARAEVPYICGKSYISLVGSAYTTNLNNFYDYQNKNGIPLEKPVPLKTTDVKTQFRPVGAEAYGTWYPWHGWQQKYEVSHEQVLGRLHEAEAVKLWTGQRQASVSNTGSTKPDVRFDANSILAARRYASATDARLPEPHSDSDINWHLVDTRVEGLAVATINGIDVGKYHDIRTPATLKQWRMQLKVADGQQVAPEIMDEYIKDLSKLQFYTGARRGRPTGSKVVDGKLIRPDQLNEGDEEIQIIEIKPKPSSQMAGAAFATDQDDSSETHSQDEMDVESIDEELDESRQASATDSHHLAKAKPLQERLGTRESLNNLKQRFYENGLDDASSSNSNSNEWLEKPPPLIRGGTEESEGGDYRE